MCYSIDEIYNLFMCDNQLSNEENEAKTQKGIDVAKQIQNLFPFMQPIVIPPEKSKMVWEPCAKVVAMRSDKELEPFLFMLLEWIQDLNWPGAMIIYNRLTQIPYNTIEFAFKCIFSKRSTLTFQALYYCILKSYLFFLLRLCYLARKRGNIFFRAFINTF